MPLHELPAGPAQLRGPLVLVAHDAGGAEILSSLVARGGLPAGIDVRLVLEGPAHAVFLRKLGPVQTWPLAQAMRGAAMLLAGTGWQSSLEWDALRQAREQGVPAIAFLDHWVNYRRRFVRQGVCCLPDALWVGDDDAWVLARAELPERPAFLVPNPYFDAMREALAALPRQAALQAAPQAGLRVLFVCEPVREPALHMHGSERHWGYTEEEALAFALDSLPALGRIDSLVVRPHPSEAPAKYDTQLAGRPWPVQRGGAASLLEEVAASDVVIGCNSVAMVIGLLAGKRVFCAIPPGGAACLLPQRQIAMLRELTTAQGTVTA
jgi:hypothetical protein